VAEATQGARSRQSRVVEYLGEVRDEVRKVVWPEREESINLTVVVMFVMILTMFVIFGIDSVLNQMFEWLLGTVG